MWAWLLLLFVGLAAPWVVFGVWEKWPGWHPIDDVVDRLGSWRRLRRAWPQPDGKCGHG